MNKLNKGEWMCSKCRKAWKENNYNVILLCTSCIAKRNYILSGEGK